MVERRRRGGRVLHELRVALREGRTVLAHVKTRLHARDAVGDLLDASGELGTEHEHVRVCKLQAVLDLIRRVAEIERHREAAGLERAEVDRQPLQAVHQEDRDLVALGESAGEQKIREAVGLLLELRPGDLGAELLNRRTFDQRIFAPGRAAGLKLLRIDLDEGDVIRPFAGVTVEDFSDAVKVHMLTSSPFSLLRPSPSGRPRIPWPLPSVRESPPCIPFLPRGRRRRSP